MTIREWTEEAEAKLLSPFAQLAVKSGERAIPEPPCPIRTAFQRDRDRILHSKAFRRLEHKTQVFLSPTGDHYRTRLTHTLEVAQIARTIARALRLNEDLTEAIALGHDLGHTPFGHAGEAILDALLPGGFRHSDQSLRVVDRLERSGRGLNLTPEVREGIQKHSKGKEGDPLVEGGEGPRTLEAQILRVADLIAYVNHDIDDALRAGLIRPADLPAELLRVVGETHSARIGTMVRSVIEESRDRPRLGMGAAVRGALLGLRAFLFERVYTDPQGRREFDKARKLLQELFEHFCQHPQEIPEEIRAVSAGEDPRRAVADFLAGMTDRYALATYRRIALPQPWMVRGPGPGW